MTQIAVIPLVVSSFLGAPPEQPNKTTNPDAAAEGPRDLDHADAPLRSFVTGQPYGKTYKDLVKTEGPPKDTTGLGEAKSHPALKHDPIEVQQSPQFLEDTATEVRYGFAVVRGVRVFRFGKLRAVQLVIEMIGREQHAKFKEDVEALSGSLKNPIAFLKLGKDGFKMKRNDLIEQPLKKPKEFPLPPLRIELEPVGFGSPTARDARALPLGQDVSGRGQDVRKSGDQEPARPVEAHP
jgi:hypothetical protein